MRQRVTRYLVPSTGTRHYSIRRARALASRYGGGIIAERWSLDHQCWLS